MPNFQKQKKLEKRKENHACHKWVYIKSIEKNYNSHIILLDLTCFNTSILIKNLIPTLMKKSFFGPFLFNAYVIHKNWCFFFFFFFAIDVFDIGYLKICHNPPCNFLRKWYFQLYAFGPILILYLFHRPTLLVRAKKIVHVGKLIFHSTNNNNSRLPPHTPRPAPTPNITPRVIWPVCLPSLIAQGQNDVLGLVHTTT